jgi:hypothetical protein
MENGDTGEEGDRGRDTLRYWRSWNGRRGEMEDKLEYQQRILRLGIARNRADLVPSPSLLNLHHDLAPIAS